MSVNVGGKQYLLGLYDTAGQVRFIFFYLWPGAKHVKDTLSHVSQSLALSRSPRVLLGPVTIRRVPNTPTGFIFRPDTKLQQVMAFGLSHMGLLPESGVPWTAMVVKRFQ